MKRSSNVNITVQPHPSRPNLLRIRWSYQGNRTVIYVPQDKYHLAQQIRTLIEDDISEGKYDASLKQYKNLLDDKLLSKPKDVPTNELYLLYEFDRYLKAIGRNENSPTTITMFVRYWFAGAILSPASST